MNHGLANFLIVLFSIANLAFNLLTSHPRSSYWWCNPRGLMALPLFLSTAGIPAYYLYYGHYPDLFGMHPEFIVEATTLVAIGAWAFTLGTAMTLPKAFLAKRVPRLPVNRSLLLDLSRLVFIAILLVTAVSYYGLFDLGFVKLVSMHYGADQWNTVDNSPWLRVSVLGTPLLCLLITLWGLTFRPFNSPSLIGICLVSLVPNIILGGRKDLIFVLITLAFATSLKRGRTSFKPILIAMSAILVFNYVQTLSRDAQSLEVSERLSALNSNQKQENELVGQICIALPIIPTVTAAMTVFPRKHDFYLGQTYCETLAGTALPKVFFGDHLFTSPNANFHDIYYPDVESFSMDFSLAAEGYQNFGLLGIPLAYFMMGCLLANLHKVASLRRDSLWGLINLLCFIPGMWSLRSDSNTFFKMSFYSSVVLLLLYFMARWRLAGSTRSAAPSRHPSAI